MSERKGQQKYIPPDYFEGNKNVNKNKNKNKKNGAARISVRMMAPFSFQCETCGRFTMKNTKFNARKETSKDTYLGQKIILLTLRCPYCSAEICLKTDPKNSDYVCEKGARRNFTPWRDDSVANETDEQRLDRLIKEEREEEEFQEKVKLYGHEQAKKITEQGPKEGEDVMKHLEDKMNDAKREMQLQDELEDLREKNARLENTGASNLASYGSSDDERENENTNENDEAEDAKDAENAFRKDVNGNIVRSEVKKVDNDVFSKADLAFSKITKKPMLKKKKGGTLGVLVKKKVDHH